MKIAVFTDSYFPHICGVTTVVQQQASYLTQQGHQVVIFCPKNNKKISENPQKNPVQIVRLPVNLPVLGYSTLPLSIPTVTKSLKKIKQIKPDLVHIHTEGGVGWEGLICAKICKLPIVTTIHTFLAHQEYLKNIKLGQLETFQKIGWKYLLALHNQANIVICPSQTMRREALNHGLKAPVTVIANGINLEQIKLSSSKKDQDNTPANDDEFNLIYIGRVAVEKKLNILLKAFQLVHQQHPQVKLTIVGSGPALSNLKQSIAQYNLESAMTLTGAINHQQLLKSDLLKQGDIFVTASKTENQPMSVLEAMAFGLPIAAVDALGMSELVEHQVNGLLAEPDNYRQLAKHCQQLIQQPKLRNKMGQASLQKVKKFSLNKTGRQLELLYQEMS